MEISNTTLTHIDIYDMSITDDKLEFDVGTCEVNKSKP